MRRPLFPGLSRPILFGHRGCSHRAPENTMPAFRLAADAGIPGIELDIQLSADGEIMVFHDETLERICHTPGRLSEFSASELVAMDAGAWKDSTFAGTPIPRLADLLDELGGRICIDIEIKYYRPQDTAQIINKLAAMIDARSLEETIIISSFDPRIVRRAKRAIPRTPAGLIYDRKSLSPWLPLRAAVRYSRADFRKPDYRLIQGTVPENRDCLTWTVDSNETARKCRERGIAGIISNRPEELF